MTNRTFNAEIFCNAPMMLLCGLLLATPLVLNCENAVREALSLSAAGMRPTVAKSKQDWREQALQHAAAEDFPRALGAVRQALRLAPENPVLLNLEGDLLESLFQFGDARDAYERVLREDIENLHAWQNSMLCQRLLRLREHPESHPSTLYALHRLMLDQDRVSEAIAISRRLDSDLALRQETWQAALDQTGLKGTVTLDATGCLELDLTRSVQPDLSLIRGFPISSLNVARTGLGSVEALRGMRLSRLDISQTPVRDLSALRGMPLKSLRLARTGVVDLSVLAGSPLEELDISNTRVYDLAALAGLPLATLRAEDTPVDDLRAVSALPLTRLYLSRSRVRDLQPLEHLGLQVLTLEGTAVNSLAPLRGCPLRELNLASTAVSDLSPLARMPLKVLTLSRCARGLDLQPLASCVQLEHLLAPFQSRHLGTLTSLPRLRFLMISDANPNDTPLLTDAPSLAANRARLPSGRQMP